MDRCTDTLAAYRLKCATASMTGQLILPESMKLLPLYTLALTKSPALRRDSVNDERALWLHRLKTLLPARTLPLLYPRLFALGALLRDPSIASAEPELPPAIIYLSAAKLADDGIFLLENGFEAYIHFGPRVEPELLMALAGAPNLGPVRSKIELLALPEYDTAPSRYLHKLIDQIRQERGHFLLVQVVPPMPPDRSPFFRNLVEDITESVTYVDCLCTVHRMHGQESRLREKPISLLQQQADGLPSNNAAYTPRHLAGYFKLDRTYAAEMFYFFFEHRSSADGPLILWMTGGPGCSSELAVFYENGPYQIEKNLSLRANPYGWDKAGSIIYVDQPINTGFSYSTDERDRVYDEELVSSDMIDFFTAFLEEHPDFKDRPLFVTGESFAGHYVPAVSYALYQHSKLHNDTGLNLQGIAIGNGLTDPGIQYGAYASFAYKNNLISKTLERGMKTVYPLCSLGISLCNTAGLDFICRSALVICQSSQFSPILASAGNINVYDIRKPCIGTLCYDFSTLDKYLAQPKVRKELGVGDRIWKSCNFRVNYDMQGDFMRNYDNLVAKLLEERDIHVMIYAGVKDLICNWLGNERWLDVLPWSNLTAFQEAKEDTWTVNGETAGTVRSVPKLSFVKIDKAGHMSPMDQPENTLDMITHFVQRKDIVSKEQVSEPLYSMSAGVSRLKPWLGTVADS